MFQDEPVKTFLTRSHLAPQAILRPTHLMQALWGFCRWIAPSCLLLRAQLWRTSTLALWIPYFSTASSSTVSGLLTFFPNCFSSFLHSTCSLSVSHIYLALEEVYLPLRAAISNNPTLRKPALSAAAPRTGLSPSWAWLSSQFCASDMI